MKRIGFYIFVASCVALGGCTPQARAKYDQAGQQMGQAAQRTTDAMATDAKATGAVIKREVNDAAAETKQATANGKVRADRTGETAEQKTKQAAGQGGNVVANAMETGKVKGALMTAPDVKTSDLNVDTIGQKVVLRGAVPDAHQKNRATQIAQKAAGPGWQVVNQLQIGHK